jgi:hypothetical protein
VIVTTTTKDCPKDLIDLYTTAFTDSTIRHNENFNTNKILNALCYSVSYEDDIPISGSMCWHKEYYNDSARIATRYYVSNCHLRTHSLRPGGKYYQKGIRTFAVDQMIQQIEFSKNIGYKNFFISIADDNSGKRTSLITKGLIYHTGLDWKTDEHDWLVYPKPEEDNCWQKIIWLGDIKLDHKR